MAVDMRVFITTQQARETPRPPIFSPLSKPGRPRSYGIPAAIPIDSATDGEVWKAAIYAYAHDVSVAL